MYRPKAPSRALGWGLNLDLADVAQPVIVVLARGGRRDDLCVRPYPIPPVVLYRDDANPRVDAVGRASCCLESTYAPVHGTFDLAACVLDLPALQDEGPRRNIAAILLG